MPTYKTPGVWVEEIPTLAPSVAQVATAIPAFIGYTEKGAGKVSRIDTLLDYVNEFGGAPPSQFDVIITGDALNVTLKSDLKFLMYYGLSLYFRNGGGTCYIVSVGDYQVQKPKATDFENGLALLDKEDEPTLIVLLDAVNLDSGDYYSLAQQALDQCHKLRNRFLILDVPNIKDPYKNIIDGFRNGVGTNYLNYAAAYHPYLQTTLTYQYEEKTVKLAWSPPGGAWSSGDQGITVTNDWDANAKVLVLKGVGEKISFSVDGNNKVLSIVLPKTSATGKQVVDAWHTEQKTGKLDSKFEIKANAGGSATINPPPLQWSSGDNGITVTHSDAASASVTIVKVETATATTFIIEGTKLTISLKAATGKQVEDAWKSFKDHKNFNISLNGDGSQPIAPSPETSLTPQQPASLYKSSQTLESIKSSDTGLYNRIKAELGNQVVVLPPSPAIAGIYVSVDRDRGVWKAPANVSVASVLGPVTKISDAAQETLNVDSTGGKSINIIRAFSGKGTLVWGARTLDGNSNEWRYVSVRRLFITIEESARKASSFAVFEPNDMMTWLKVKAMIDSQRFRAL